MGGNLGLFRIQLSDVTVRAIRKAHLMPGTLAASVNDAAGNRSQREWDVRLKIAKPLRAATG